MITVGWFAYRVTLCLKGTHSSHTHTLTLQTTLNNLKNNHTCNISVLNSYFGMKYISARSIRGHEVEHF